MGTPSDNLYLTGLPLEMDEPQMRAIFNQYGTVRQIKLMSPQLGKPDLVALLRMSSVEEAAWIVENIHGNIPSGLTTPVSVKFSKSHDGGGGYGMPVTGAVVPPPTRSMFSAAPVAQVPMFSGGGGGGGLLQTNVLLSGCVRRWNITKGFGFIVPDGGGPDVFVHAQELSDGEVLVQGSQVMFEAMEDPSKGPGMYRAKLCMGAIKKDQLNSAAPPCDNLFITGMPLELSEEDIRAIFSQYGTVASVRKLPQQAGKMDCAALVRMADASQAKWLVDNVNGNIPSGLATPVSVNYAEKKGGPSATGQTVMPALATAGLGSFNKAIADSLAGSSPYGTTPPVAADPNRMGFS